MERTRQAIARWGPVLDPWRAHMEQIVPTHPYGMHVDLVQTVSTVAWREFVLRALCANKTPRGGEETSRRTERGAAAETTPVASSSGTVAANAFGTWITSRYSTRSSPPSMARTHSR